MMGKFTWILVLFLLLSAMIMITSSPTERHHGAVLPSPGLATPQGADNQGIGNFFNISPFLTNTLIQAIAEESELKRRVQRYRDIEK